MENTQVQSRQSSAVSTFAKRAIAWVVVIAVAVLALKIVAGAVIGLVTMVLTFALIVGVVAAVIWALRRI